MPEVGFDKSPLHNLPGCYHTLWAVLFNKLPFGIFSAPKIFQKMMNNILEDICGVLRHMDDVLVYGKDNQEHDSCLTAVLKRIKAAGIRLNPTKCEFSRSSLTSYQPERNLPRTSKNISHQRHATTQECYRTPKILGNGKPTREVLPQHL